MAGNLKTVVATTAAGMLLTAGALIVRWEGHKSVPYQDVVGVWTVCYGHTGADVVPGSTYSKEECDRLLQKDMAIARAQVHRCIPPPLPPGPEAALISATFNLGPRVVCGSTLQRYAITDDWGRACAELDKWKYAGGRVYKGLVLRRADERAVCEGRKG